MANRLFVFVCLLFCLASTVSFAATCKIKIEDVNKITTYDIIVDFDDLAKGQRKHFKTPGNNCHLLWAFSA